MDEQFDPESWHRWKRLFEEAADLDSARQEEALDTHCQGDMELRRRFSAMLSAHRHSTTMIDRSLPERFIALSVEDACGPPPQPLPLTEDTLLKDRYRIQKGIGTGGWSAVYLAKDESMNGRNVVIKVLLQENSHRSVIDDEIAALANLHHPAIAAPLDSGTTPDGRRFLVLAYVPGKTLRATLVQHGPLDAGTVVRLLRIMGSALETAHTQGVCHLDLKPENIMLQNVGGQLDPVIVDFGISRLLHTPGAATSSPAGTLAYIAPEQLEGEPGIASDQYSLALIAAEMLTGRKPPPLGSARATLAACEHLSPKARRALSRSLSAAPIYRFPDVGAFVTALTTTLDPERRRYRRLGVAAISSVALLLVAGVAYLWLDSRKEQRLIASDMKTISEQMAVWVRLADSSHVPPGALDQAFSGPLTRLQRLVDEGHRDSAMLTTLSDSLALYGTYLGHPGRRNIGESEKGIAALRQSLELAKLLSKDSPKSRRWRVFMAEKFDMLASILVEAGEYEQASQAARKGLSLLDDFPGLERNYRSSASIRGGLLMTLSRVHFHRREFGECLQLRDEVVASRHLILAVNENNRPARYDLAGVLATRGYLLLEMGRLDEAFRDYSESESVLKTLLIEESSNLQFRWLHARNAMETGRLFLLKKQTRTATAHLAEGVRLMRGMLDDSRHEITSMRTYGLCLSWLAVARFRQGARTQEVRTLIAEALQVNQAAVDQDPRNAKTREERSVILQNAREIGTVTVFADQIP